MLQTASNCLLRSEEEQFVVLPQRLFSYSQIYVRLQIPITSLATLALPLVVNVVLSANQLSAASCATHRSSKISLAQIQLLGQNDNETGLIHISDYMPDQYDMGLRDALNDFREQETIKKFGKSQLKNSGPGLIMPNDILKRIVDCVHAQKITNKDDLQLETHWSCVDLFADTVLAIIDMCCRPSPAPGVVL